MGGFGSISQMRWTDQQQVHQEVEADHIERDKVRCCDSRADTALIRIEVGQHYVWEIDRRERHE